MTFARTRTVLLMIVAVSFSAARAETDAERRSRIERLENALLAPCCYEEPVARHQSGIAIKMRLEISKWVKEGKTDDAILAAYKERYGDRVLAPPPRDEWLVTDGIPWLLILLAGAGVAWMIYRLRVKRARATVAVPAAGLAPVPESDEDWDRFDGARHNTLDGTSE